MTSFAAELTVDLARAARSDALFVAAEVMPVAVELTVEVARAPRSEAVLVTVVALFVAVVVVVALVVASTTAVVTTAGVGAAGAGAGLDTGVETGAAGVGAAVVGVAGVTVCTGVAVCVMDCVAVVTVGAAGVPRRSPACATSAKATARIVAAPRTRSRPSRVPIALAIELSFSKLKRR